MIIKFIVKIYQAIFGFLLNNSGCKVGWGNKREMKDIDDKIGDHFLR